MRGMIQRPELDFAHKFVAPHGASGTILLLLNGTGGDENDLIPVAREVSPVAGILSPRGKVLDSNHHGLSKDTQGRTEEGRGCKSVTCMELRSPYTASGY